VVARTQAILRRASGTAPTTAPEPTGALLTHGCLALDTESWRARWEGREVVLTVTEFAMLRALAARPGKVFSRDELIDRLHGPGFAVTDRTIDSHIRNIRAKFAAVGAAGLIETRAGIGYALGPCTGSGAGAAAG
jgi:two-component system OmpR family response regulator